MQKARIETGVVCAYMPILCRTNKPKHGKFEAANKKFNCCGRAVAVIWKRHEDTVSEDLPGGDITSEMEHKSGRKAEHTTEGISKLISAAPFKDGQTLWDLGVCMSVPEQHSRGI